MRGRNGCAGSHAAAGHVKWQAWRCHEVLQGPIFQAEPRLLRELRQCEVELDRLGCGADLAERRLHMNAGLTAQRPAQWRDAVQLMKEMRQAAS